MTILPTARRYGMRIRTGRNGFMQVLWYMIKGYSRALHLAADASSGLTMIRKRNLLTEYLSDEESVIDEGKVAQALREDRTSDGIRYGADFAAFTP